MSLALPKPLRPGDRVAVVCPAGPVESDALDAGVAWLGGRYRVDADPRRAARTGYLAGTDETRAAALLDALRDPEVRAIVAGRGGYGVMRVLERHGAALRDALARDPKWLVGFSDLTALHALWAQVGVASIHGPMAGAIGRGTVLARDRDEVLALLEGAAPERWHGLSVLREGEAEGPALGGNLALLAALHGTPYAMPLEGAVLFLEDVGERPYRVDRMLTTLRLGGALTSLRAVVLGEFTDCGPGPDGVTVEDVLRERLGDLGVPVVAGAPFGHGREQRPWLHGGRVLVRARETTGGVEHER